MHEVLGTVGHTHKKPVVLIWRADVVNFIGSQDKIDLLVLYSFSSERALSSLDIH